MRILTSFLHLICQISVTEQLFLNFKIAASDFVIVGCEQLPLIFAELKVLISDVRQAHTSQTHAELSREQQKDANVSGGSSSPTPHQGRWHLRAHVHIYFLVQCRIPARFRMEAACTTAGWTAPGFTVPAESASFWQKTEKPVKVNSPTHISCSSESVASFLI